MNKCDNCPLQGGNVVGGCGPPPEEAHAVVVGEAPGRDEDLQGKPFVGRSGQLLRAVLDSVGLPEDKVYFTNVVKCRPPGNRIQPEHIEYCKQSLGEELRPYSRGGVPILLVGATPAKVIIGSRFSASMRGRWQKGAKVLPTWHPAFVLREPKVFWDFYFACQKLSKGAHPPIPIEYQIFGAALPGPEGAWEWLLDQQTRRPDCTMVFDLECESASPYWKYDVLSMAIAYDFNKAIVLTENFLYSDEGRLWLASFFGSSFKLCGHNVKFDLRYLIYQLGVKNARAEYDSMLAHWVLYEESAHDLKTLAGHYCNAPEYEHVIKRFINPNKGNWREVPPEILYRYNAHDVCYNLQVWHQLAVELKDDMLFKRPFMFPIMASQPALMECELNGMLIDEEKGWEVYHALEEHALQLHGTMSEMVGYDFNPRSPKQVSPIVYEHFGAPVVRGRGFKPGSTCKEARELILRRVPPDSEVATWLQLYGQYRSAKKVQASYVTNPLERIGPDGRVHCDIKVHGARTGRLSVSDPPLHAIPHPGRAKEGQHDWGLDIRGMFVAEEGWKMLMADYSQAELRVVACMSKDPFLLESYQEGRDLHSEAARLVYGDDFTPRHRQICKSVNFSQVYGGSPESAAAEADMDPQAIRKLSSTYHRIMARLYEWRTEQFQLLCRQGWVATCTGRRRRAPLVTRSNRDDARKMAVNAPVQGSASELTLISLMRVRDWIENTGNEHLARVLLTVHDSVVLEVREEAVEMLATVTRDFMVQTGSHYFPDVPWVVEVEVGDSWGTVEEYTLP